MTTPTKLRILKFRSETCGYCLSMDKKQVLETVVKEYPGTEVVTLTISDKEGMSPDGSTYEAAYEISDLHEVSALPCYVIQDEYGVEFGRVDGASTLTDFRKEVAKAVEEIKHVRETHARVEALRARH